MKERSSSTVLVEQFLEILEAVLAERGIVDEGVFVDNVFVNATFAAAPLFRSAYADPGMVPALWAPTVSGLKGGYVAHDETLTGLIRSQLSTPTGTERTEMLTRICEMAEESAPMIPLVAKWKRAPIAAARGGHRALDYSPPASPSATPSASRNPDFPSNEA